MKNYQKKKKKSPNLELQPNDRVGHQTIGNSISRTAEFSSTVHIRTGKKLSLTYEIEFLNHQTS